MRFTIKSLFLIITVCAFLEGWAEGHGLCSSSAGFRKALHILEQDEDLSYIAEKIRAHEALDADEIDFFYGAYKIGIEKDAVLLTKEFSEFGIQLSTVDKVLAMRYILEEGVSPSEAVDRAVYSRAARYASTSRPPADVAIASILEGKNAVYIGGKRMSDSTLLIIRAYGKQYFARTGSIAIRGELIRYLAPDQYEALFNSPTESLQSIYNKFNQFNVGDVEIVFYRYKPVLLQDEFETAGQSVLVQRISNDKMLLFNPIESTVHIFDIKNTPLSFERALQTDIIHVFNENMNAIVRAYYLPGETTLELYTRLTTIDACLRVFRQNFAGFPDSLRDAFRAGEVRPLRYMLSSMDFSSFFSVYAD